MNREISVIQRKKIRGHILKILELSHPTATFESAVAAGLIQRGLLSSPDISEYTDYLLGKDYITSVGHPDRFDIGEKLLKLTPHGVDLLEDTIQDPGVEV